MQLILPAIYFSLPTLKDSVTSSSGTSETNYHSTRHHISKNSILHAFSHNHKKLSELYAGRDVHRMALLLMPLHKFHQCFVHGIFQISSEILMGKVSKTA
jgi:hypothetical protein